MLAIIGEIGTAGGTGYALEFAGSAIESLSMEGRMTVCNMAIEAGARAGMIAPDDTTFNYLHGRPRAPAGAEWDAAVSRWRALVSDPGAEYDRSVSIDANTLQPMVTFGTNPGMAIAVNEPVPDGGDDPSFRKALDYMQVEAGKPMTENAVDVVFVGSCTNGRIEDLRMAAKVLAGRKAVVPGLVSPGSAQVKKQAEAEGLARIFTEAGLDPASLFFDSFEYSSDALDGMLHSAASGEDQKD